MGKLKLPEWLVPMAATLTAERFTGDEWVFERKLDGIRLLAYKQGNEVTLWSRNRLAQNHAYPSVVEAVRALPFDTLILDGEATGVWGRAGRTQYHVFDIPWLEGDVTALPWTERAALLDAMPFD
jgi:ATP-dependent DNA ligase